MNTTKKDKAIKEINVRELKANYRTAFVLVSIFFLALGLIGGYFAAINVITDSQSKAIEVVSNLTTLKQ